MILQTQECFFLWIVILDYAYYSPCFLSFHLSSGTQNIAGKKYLIFDYIAGDNAEFWLFSEDGKNIQVDLSKIGLSATIPGMYGLKFGGWIPIL